MKIYENIIYIFSISLGNTEFYHVSPASTPWALDGTGEALQVRLDLGPEALPGLFAGRNLVPQPANHSQ